MYHIGDHMSEKRILKCFLCVMNKSRHGKLSRFQILQADLFEKLSKKCDVWISNVFAAVKKSYHFQTQIRSLV